MKYDFILFDADDTLFDFQKCANKCFTKTCVEFGFPKEKISYPVYRDINQKLWDLYSLSKIEKSVILVRRFEEYGERFGLKFNSSDFFKSYEEKLAHTVFLFSDTKCTLEYLKKRAIKIYLITNGVKFVQRTRLSLSGIEEFFDGVFISDEIGHAKPSKEYFEFVRQNIPSFDVNKALIVGDSLISDIQLGINNGIDTCLISRRKKSSSTLPTYKIKSLDELKEIIKEDENG